MKSTCTNNSVVVEQDERATVCAEYECATVQTELDQMLDIDELDLNEHKNNSFVITELRSFSSE